MTIAILVITGSELSQLNTIQNNQCCSCYDRNRQKAISIGAQITTALNLLSTDPTSSTALFTAPFAPDGVWSTTVGNVFGKSNVMAFYASYAFNPGETNQTIVTHQNYWDGKTSTLSLQRNWTATITAPRQFTNLTNNTIDFYPVNFTYTQDDFVIIRFNCLFEIVYYREYFDSVQAVSFYTEDYETPCLPCYFPLYCLS